MEKPIVNFIHSTAVGKPSIGFSAYVQVINHPRQAEFELTDGFVRTSPVVWVSEDGREFETKNSKYVAV